jgi:hypothetical protein
MTQTGFEWRKGAYAKNGETLNQFTDNNISKDERNYPLNGPAGWNSISISDSWQ